MPWPSDSKDYDIRALQSSAFQKEENSGSGLGEKGVAEDGQSAVTYPYSVLRYPMAGKRFETPKTNGVRLR